MSWSYRIVKKKNNDAVWYGIHEVFYDDEGKPTMCTEDPITLEAESMKDFGWMLSQFKIATNQPWLNYKDFGQDKKSDSHYRLLGDLI